MSPPTPFKSEVVHSDCLEYMETMLDDVVDLVFCSPPYEKARTYGIDFSFESYGWVDWAVNRYLECSRVCRGLVAWVVEGRTRNFEWSATPAILMAELHKRGVKLRKPPAFCRVGIPGSGGPDWLRNDYEFIVCSSKGKLPWSDNTAMGKPPKYQAGGVCSNQLRDGRRQKKPTDKYAKPKVANPGNLIRCVVGGGRMGSPLAHENEAPFPEALAEFFVRSFCPPGGIVMDPFCGSGTTLKVAHGLERLHELVKELHKAIIGLLWQIDDLKHFDESTWESHFDQTIPHEHAQSLHRLLMTRHTKEVMKFYPSGDYQEFDDWWHRCQVADSFKGGRLIQWGR